MTMARKHHGIKLLHGQRGAVVIWFALLLPVLLGFAALAVDLARLNLIKVELQNAADAAALAGARSLTDPAGTKPYSWQVAEDTATTVAKKNYANGALVQGANANIDQDANVSVDSGFWNFTSTPPSYTAGHVSNHTGDIPAVHATVSISGLNLFFAPILGINTKDIHASAVAILSGAGGPFDYGIFSGSTTSNLSINGSGYNVKGSVHTNKNLTINGSSITITDAAEAKGTITTNGSGINIGSRSPNSSLISMPDYSASIAAAAAAAHQTYTGSKTFNGSGITSDPIYVQGSPGTVTVNGSAFTATGAVLADGNITINGSGMASANSQVCFYSKNGDITINGSGYALNGVLYAPNGRIIINGSGITINGSVVGNQVNINGSTIKVNRTDYQITSLPGSHVQLVE
jgi:Flp pilus assembly protein TadG/formylmethanofuran dehydrogenase subunit C